MPWVCSSCSLRNNDGTVSCTTCGFTNSQAILKYPGVDNTDGNTMTSATDNPGSVSSLDDVGKVLFITFIISVVMLTYSAKYPCVKFCR